MRHLLVTNDFPPKIGGIQSYLWELWRRLPPDGTVVLTTAHDGDEAFDSVAPMRIVRHEAPVLLPTPALRERIDAVADEIDADLVLLDPALPLGALGPSLARPYGLVLHGAEITVPGRIPLSRPALARVLRGAELVIAAGGYPADEGERAARRGLPVEVIPPGVDTERFRPLDEAERATARKRFDVEPDADLIVSVSRLVPRKGFDVLIRAAAELHRHHPALRVLIGGTGRDHGRLRRLADRLGAPVRLLGRVDSEDLPLLYGAADIFSMTCRSRWFGLEQEGFGIVFLEAAASGVAQIAGASGGAAEAVEAGRTGLIVSDPTSVEETITVLDRLLRDPDLRVRMGRRARVRAVRDFSYDVLARRLDEILGGAGPNR